MKKCSKCGIEKPATTEYFGRLKSGFQSWCKQCKSEHHLANREEILKKNKERRRAKHPIEEIPEGHKKCSSCKEVKPKTNEFFSFNKSAKDGFAWRCKECRKNAEYWADVEKAKNERKKYYEENKEKVSIFNKKYRESNKEKYRQKDKKYYIKNKEQIKNRVKEYHYNRIQEDVGYRLLQRCRKRLWDALKGISKSKRTLELIGCSIEELMLHLESQFTEGMSWDNYGEWHVDHIRPCASFDFTKEDQQNECFHYTNLQPLWAEDNRKKSDKII